MINSFAAPRRPDMRSKLVRARLGRSFSPAKGTSGRRSSAQWKLHGAACASTGDANNTRIVLRDPNAAEDALLVIDRPRFEDIWSGDVVLVKRNYEISDESQPFSFGLVAALLFRERRIVRDVAISALILGFLGLAPIMFWRLLSDKVIFYKAYNTFYVLCLSMLVIIAFEAAFSFLRQFLVHRLTTRLDVKLSTYVFEKVLNLPIDYFEQTAVGLVSRDIREVFRIRTFLMGQLFGTILDSTTLIFFLPVMFFFSPIMTFGGPGSCRD